MKIRIEIELDGDAAPDNIADALAVLTNFSCGVEDVEDTSESAVGKHKKSATKTERVNIRTTAENKSQAERLAGHMGVSLNKIYEQAVQEMAKTKGIELVAPDVEPPAAPKSVAQQAAQFALDCIKPDDGSRVLLTDIPRAYLNWCWANDAEPLQVEAIGASLSKLFEKAGIEVLEAEGKLVALGVRLTAPVGVVEAA